MTAQSNIATAMQNNAVMAKLKVGEIGVFASSQERTPPEMPIVRTTK